MIDVEQALSLIADLPSAGVAEVRPLLDALGCVTAAPVTMNRDQPPFDRATMDGYAIALDGDRSSFDVIGTVHAGETAAVNPQPGQAVRIMTGAPCPPDVTVVPIERTDGGETTVTVTDTDSLVPGRNIAWRGEDAAAGATVVPAGTRLDATALAAVAMAGANQVAVWQPPAVTILTTGDEVGASGEAGIADSNGPLLLGLCQAMGLSPIRQHITDQTDALIAALQGAAASGGIVITTGGVSAGSRDLVPAAATAAGFGQVFHHVAMQPGKPLLCARHASGAMLLGLPGNPVSVLATAHIFLPATLERWLPGLRSGWIDATIAVPWQHRKRRRLFLPCRFTAGGVTPIDWNGSGDLLAATHGDGLIDLSPGCALQPGDVVRVLPYAGHQPGAGLPLPSGRGSADRC